jgi:predicted nucleic acid-binding protein
LATWLIDTALLMTLRTPRANAIRVWAEANQTSLYLSTASLFEIARAIARTPASQSHKREPLRAWINGLSREFANRIHDLDAETALRAGPLVSNLTASHVRHRFHDAVLVATAQIHGHGLLTRRDATFGAWTKIPLAAP